MNKTSIATYVLALLLSPAVHATNNIDELRESWVLKARDGEISLAAQGLTSLYKQTKDPKTLNDLIAILSWQGDPNAVINACQPCDLNDLTPDSIEVLAKALRNNQRYAMSAKYYQRLTQLVPNHPDAWLGLALASAESKDLAGARKGLNTYRQRFSLDANFYQDWIYISRTLNDQVGELFAWQNWLAAEPHNKAVGLGLYKSAIQLGAAPAVKDLLTQHPDWFTSSDHLWFDYDEATIKLRDGSKANSPATLHHSAELLKKVIEKAPHDHPVYRSAYLDYFYVLVALQDFETAAPIAEDLAKQNTLPVYIQERQADYYLGTQQPSKALPIYWKLHQAEPKNPLLSSKLYYAYMDSERYDEANALLTSLKQWIPTYRWDFTGSTKHINDDYQTLKQLEVLHFAWRGDMVQATEIIDTMLIDAPGNPYLLAIKGDIERWKGNPDRSEQYFERASQLLSPKEQGIVERGKLMAQLERGEWNGLESKLTSLNQKYPEADQRSTNKAVKEAAAPVWVGEYSQGDTSNNGGSLVQASRDWTYDTRLYTGRLGYGDRLFLRDQMIFGDFDNNNLYTRYSGIGAEIALYPITLTLETGLGSRLNDKYYLWATADYRLSDSWRFSVSYKNNSNDTPLRALFDETYVDDRYASLTYRITSELNWGLSSTYADYTDGNERQQYVTWLNGQLWRTDNYSLRGSVGYSMSFNDAIDSASYFNPLSDRSGSLTFTQSYHLRLSDSWGFDQELYTGISSYWQENFDSDYNWDINYRLKWIWKKRTNVSYGVGRNKGVYDGGSEYRNYIFVDFEVRFM
ncbi:poly-beta-1,6 N-acetyl-D-glucosamine export porin PgaA [Photobacterium sagamiensis]|uniref:poly-beta-1,6 N-acetyl-D-glucosamine export porin PgaA n=1 Tax=Photobacterium sagamiensis TaxID=2910241 RepID=UPI003D142460